MPRAHRQPRRNGGVEMTGQNGYARLLEAMSELADIAHAQALMGWDQETNMPPKGARMRARSLGTLAGFYHDKLTMQPLVDLIEDLKQADLAGDEAVNLRELDREQARARKIPRELIVELSETASLGHEAWVTARADDDFAHYRPWLEKMLRLKTQVADIVSFEGSIYNALLDEYEPYATAEEIGPVFAELRQHLVRMVEQIATVDRPPFDALERPFPVALQEQFWAPASWEEMGFDLEAGRLDISVHPFCSGIGPEDVRLTTRYDENGFTQSLFGIIHETGHGLYEQGLPADQETLPAGRAVSLGIHESQSRLWENMIGRSRQFWSHYLPVLKELFPTPVGRGRFGRFLPRDQQGRTLPGTSRSGRGDLQSPYPAALRTRARAARGRAVGGRATRSLESTHGGIIWESDLPTMPWGFYKTSIGLSVCSGTSPPTPWAIFTPLSSTTARSEIFPI